MNDIFTYVSLCFIAWMIVFDIIPRIKDCFNQFFAIRKTFYVNLGVEADMQYDDSPLHHVIRHRGSTEAMLASWRAGCSLEHRNNEGDTPYQLAMKLGDAEKVKLLHMMHTAESQIKVE